jgi:ammonia channel protein AmtB
MKINKKQLDALGTICGLIAGISAVLGTNGVISQKVAGTVGGIATVCLGVIVQRPANETPTTEEAEEEAVHNNP